MKPRRVFIGFDPRQPLAFTVAAHSMLEASSVPVAITPLILRQLPITRRGLTEFTFSRYLVPYLCGYEGHALFIDADVLVRQDIAKLPWEHEHDVAVVPHDHVLVDGQRVSVRFERASVMLFNCAACKVLTPEFIEKDEPQNFAWARSVGDLPREWNHLVGYDPPGPAAIAHFTQGIPCFDETRGDEYGESWLEALARATKTCSWAEIMGGSVHRRFKQPAAPGVAQLLSLQGGRRG
jgi:hypothetical protein